MKKSIIKIAGVMAIFTCIIAFYAEDSNAKTSKSMNIAAFTDEVDAGGGCKGPKVEGRPGDYVCESTNTVDCKDLFGCK